MQLRANISERERELSRARSRAQRDAVNDLAAQLRPGDVIRGPSRRRSGHAVVLERPNAPGLDGPVVSGVTADARLRKLSSQDLPYGTRTLTRVRIPKGFNPRKPAARRDIRAAMRSALGALADDDRAGKRHKIPSTAAKIGRASCRDRVEI